MAKRAEAGERRRSAPKVNLDKNPEIKFEQKIFENPTVDNSEKMLDVIKAFGIRYKETTIDQETELKIKTKYLGSKSVYLVSFIYGNVVLLHYNKLSERNKSLVSLHGISLSGETESSKFYKYYKENNYYCIPVYNPILENLF